MTHGSGQEQHEVISLLKELALSLGRSPKVTDLTGIRGLSKYRVERVFGHFAVAMQAAGLEMSRPTVRAAKIGNEVFERNLSAHLEKYKPKPAQPQAPYPKIAILPDVHFPWPNQRVLDAFYSFIETHQPEHVIQIGDLYDMYSHAKFPRSHNVFTPREEEDISRKMAVEMWAKIKTLCPNAILTQCSGNHDLRALKRVLEVMPSAQDWIQRAVEALLTFDGVKTIFDQREELIIADIAIFHGYRSQAGSHRDYTHMNCITGHVHVGDVTFRQIQGRVLWDLRTGFAGNPEGKGLTYTPQKITHWTPGFGFVWPWGPQFIPVL